MQENKEKRNRRKTTENTVQERLKIEDKKKNKTLTTFMAMSIFSPSGYMDLEQ